VVLMHSRGTRETLHKQARMSDAVAEVNDSMSHAAAQVVFAGIEPEAIVLDPGIGFGKAANESIAILKSLHGFSKIGYPVLVGTSRKSFIHLLTSDQEQGRIWGT